MGSEGGKVSSLQDPVGRDGVSHLRRRAGDIQERLPVAGVGSRSAPGEVSSGDRFPFPFPYGSRNEPANVRVVAQEIAGVRGVFWEEVARTTTGNAALLSGL